MDWRKLWKRVRGGRVPARLGKYEDLAPFAGRRDFFTGTHIYPAEPATACSFLIRVSGDQDPEAVARLTWHARLMHQLQSPYIPHLADLGLDGALWYVSFRINPPLRVLPLPEGDGLAIVRQVAEGLAYLHEQGLAHRGLSPSAIAVNGIGVAVLFDLWWMGRLGEDRKVRSVIGRRPRTPYDAPEASEQEFDGVRADIYGLGMLARELLPAGSHTALVKEMTHESPAGRPSSLAAVLRAMGSE